MSKFTEWLAKSGSADLWRAGKQHKSKSQRRLVEFTVTFDELEDVDNPAPPELDSQLPDLVQQIHEDPAAVLPKVEALLEQFPDECHLLNLYANALSATGQEQRTREVTERNYQLHPNYLFARVNHAELLLAAGQADAVPAVFGGQFNLKRMYPHRNTFHYTEVVSFYSVLGRYYVATGEGELAENCLDLLQQIDPEHNGTLVLAVSIKRAMLTGAMQKLQKMVRGVPPAPAPGGALPGPRPSPQDRRREKKRKKR